ncbi:MAG: hypothetical protein AABX38_01005 [Candidatus Micrarchaeota archaeon]|mgnify:CR=1 FL=1
MAGVGGTLKSIGDWFRPSQARLEKETETKEFLTRVGRAPLTDFLEARSGRIGIFTSEINTVLPGYGSIFVRRSLARKLGRIADGERNITFTGEETQHFLALEKEYLEVRTFLADQLTTIEEYAKLRSAANGIFGSNTLRGGWIFGRQDVEELFLQECGARSDAVANELIINVQTLAFEPAGEATRFMDELRAIRRETRDDFLTVKVNSLVASLNPHSGIDDALNLLKSAIIAGSGSTLGRASAISNLEVIYSDYTTHIDSFIDNVAGATPPPAVLTALQDRYLILNDASIRISNLSDNLVLERTALNSSLAGEMTAFRTAMDGMVGKFLSREKGRFQNPAKRVVELFLESNPELVRILGRLPAISASQQEIQQERDQKKLLRRLRDVLFHKFGAVEMAVFSAVFSVTVALLGLAIKFPTLPVLGYVYKTEIGQYAKKKYQENFGKKEKPDLTKEEKAKLDAENKSLKDVSTIPVEKLGVKQKEFLQNNQKAWIVAQIYLLKKYGYTEVYSEEEIKDLNETLEKMRNDELVKAMDQRLRIGPKQLTEALAKLKEQSGIELILSADKSGTQKQQIKLGKKVGTDQLEDLLKSLGLVEKPVEQKPVQPVKTKKGPVAPAPKPGRMR